MRFFSRLIFRMIVLVLVCGLAMQAGYLLQYQREGRKALSEVYDNPQTRSLLQAYGPSAPPAETFTESAAHDRAFSRALGEKEVWSIRKGRLNGIPYEVSRLNSSKTAKQVLEEHRRNWHYQGIEAIGGVNGAQGELNGAQMRTGRAFHLQVNEVKTKEGRQTQAEITAYGPAHNGQAGMYYPERLPKPLWPEGLMVTQSEEGPVEMTHITWGSRRSLQELNFYLMREMFEKGWQLYHGMPGAKDAPQLFSREFYDAHGGQCSLTLIPAQSLLCAVQITARWPKTASPR